MSFLNDTACVTSEEGYLTVNLPPLLDIRDVDLCTSRLL